MITKTEKEIEAQIDKATEAIENGGKYHGMSYEDGIKAALEWVLYGGEEPMD